MTLDLGSKAIRKYKDNPKTTWEHSMVHSYPCRKIFLALALKKYAETEIKVFLTATGFKPKKLSGYGFESYCNHLNFRYPTCFEQGVP